MTALNTCKGKLITEAVRLISTKNPKGTKKIDGEWGTNEECYKIQGAVFERYREMVCGFLERLSRMHDIR